MIVQETPRVRAKLAAALAATPHVHEGKFALIDATGSIALATTEAEAMGVITEPDSLLAAQAGNATSASLLYRSFGGIVEVQIGAGSAAVTAGAKLYLKSDGTVYVPGTSDDASDLVPVARATAAAPATAGQLIPAILL